VTEGAPERAGDGGEALWSFSLRVYGASGVEAACLALQERSRADVGLLLLACWLGTRGRALTPPEIAALRAVSRRWQEGVLRPLRGARRSLKGLVADAPAATLAGDIAALRKRALEVELDAERLAQRAFLAALGGGIEGGASSLAAAAGNLRALLDPAPGDAAFLMTLLAAVFPEHDDAGIRSALASVWQDEDELPES
jgi:uncharacterized protein (TIGR02444 family)